jgi:caspase domain-containing protein
MPQPDLYALLIGVGGYLQRPGGVSYPPLAGSVGDVLHMETFLRGNLGVPPENILKLTASAGGSEPPEPRDQWPTYAHMVLAFQQVTEQARPGDQVYIHYSGHGGRAETRYPGFKGEGAFDESLVPVDICDPNALYLTDVEISFLLRRMVAKGLVVTVVLDSCYSGGAVRKDAAPRGVEWTDRTKRPGESLVASNEELAKTWGQLHGTTPDGGAVAGRRPQNGEVLRSFQSAGRFLPKAEGYVLLAACEPAQMAMEYAFDHDEREGVLTHWLLDSMRSFPIPPTYQQLRDRIVAKVSSEFPSQTPMVIGQADRIAFGLDRVSMPHSVNVLNVQCGRLMLNTGASQGVGKGARFAVYAPQADLSGKSPRLALVEIREPGTTESWADIVEPSRAGSVEPGAPALLIHPGGDGPQSAVRLAPGLEEVAAVLAAEGAGFVRPADEAERADFHVTVDAHGAYQIQDEEARALSNLGSPLRTGEPDAISALVRRLVHLVRYRRVQRLDNPNVNSELAGTLVVEPLGVVRRFDPFRLHPFPAGGDLEVEPGDCAYLKITNRSSRVLHLAVLDLEDDWSVTQVFPAADDSPFYALDRNGSHVLDLRADLGPGCTEGRDLIKIFGTTRATDYRWLQLSSLCSPRPQEATRGATRGVGKDAPESRPPVGLVPQTAAGKHWTVTTVELHIRRRAFAGVLRGG